MSAARSALLGPYQLIPPVSVRNQRRKPETFGIIDAKALDHFVIFIRRTPNLLPDITETWCRLVAIKHRPCFELHPKKPLCRINDRVSSVRCTGCWQFPAESRLQRESQGFPCSVLYFPSSLVRHDKRAPESDTFGLLEVRPIDFGERKPNVPAAISHRRWGLGGGGGVG